MVVLYHPNSVKYELLFITFVKLLKSYFVMRGERNVRKYFTLGANLNILKTMRMKWIHYGSFIFLKIVLLIWNLGSVQKFRNTWGGISFRPPFEGCLGVVHKRRPRKIWIFDFTLPRCRHLNYFFLSKMTNVQNPRPLLPTKLCKV